MGHGHTKTDKIYMRGPGGRGEVEVAVSGIAGPWHFLSEIFYEFFMFQGYLGKKKGEIKYLVNI